MRFRDRCEAGQKLAAKLTAYRNKPNTLILALPRGGVPVAYEIATALNLPLDIMLVRKLGVPGYEEVAMGAIAMDNVQVMNEHVMEGLNIPAFMLEDVVRAEHKELHRRNWLYRRNRPFPELKGKNIILVDDGIATGANMQAAIMATKRHKPGQIIVAVPVASASAFSTLWDLADEVVCLDIPEPFNGVGASYLNFDQTSDAAVIALLTKAQGGGNDNHETHRTPASSQ